MMPEPATILQILLLKDEAESRELDRALWAAFQEIEAFYNRDQLRARFKRFYMSKTSPGSWLDSVLGRWKDSNWSHIQDDFWKKASGRYSNTCDQQRLAELVSEQLGSAESGDLRLIVTDQEMTPPKGWSYIIWDGIPHGAMVSIAPIDPRYWREDEADRINVIKHRVRTALLCATGQLLGFERCENEHCFLFSDVDSVVRLDEMIELGDEHQVTALVGYGYRPLVPDPNKVQDIVAFSRAAS